MKFLSIFLVLVNFFFAAELHAEKESEIFTHSEVGAREQLLNLVAGEWIAQSIYAVAKLDVASHLMHGPKTVNELAELTDCDVENLYRLMRMLASIGMFHEEENHYFINTKVSELLAKDHPQNLRALILFYSGEMSQTWTHALDCIKTGKPAFDLKFNQPVFEYFRSHPISAQCFNAAMKEKSQVVISSCMRAFNFSRFSSIYDLGGGLGHFLAALLSVYPHMQGALYELPEVVGKAKVVLLPFKERCQLISGNFFKHIPKGGDAYLLKSVIHDWNDSDSLTILNKCHQAMNKDDRLIIVEPIMTEANQKEMAKFMDVYMMMITGGKERTLLDFKMLLDQAGFSIESVTATETEFYLIEARKKM